MNKKKHGGHRFYRALGFILVAVAVVCYIANVGVTSVQLAVWPGAGGGGYEAANNYSLRSLLILALFIVGVLLIVLGK